MEIVKMKCNSCGGEVPNDPAFMRGHSITSHNGNIISFDPVAEKILLPTIKVKKLDPAAQLPTKSHWGEDMAYDLYALENCTVGSIPQKVRTGIAIELPKGFGAVIRDRSGMSMKGFRSCGGTMDNGYRGEWFVTLVCNGHFSGEIKAGDRIAQFVPVKIYEWEIEEVQELSESARGEKGYGSSGR